MYGLQDMLACFRVVDKRVALRAVNDLKVLRSRLAEDGLRGHGVEAREGGRVERSGGRDQIFRRCCRSEDRSLTLRDMPDREPGARCSQRLYYVIRL